MTAGDVPNEHDAAWAYVLARKDDALRRAASQFASAQAPDMVRESFVRWVRVLRRRGDDRPENSAPHGGLAVGRVQRDDEDICALSHEPFRAGGSGRSRRKDAGCALCG